MSSMRPPIEAGPIERKRNGASSGSAATAAPLAGERRDGEGERDHRHGEKRELTKCGSHRTHPDGGRTTGISEARPGGAVSSPPPRPRRPSYPNAPPAPQR